jgi:hypothetical protein
MCLVAAALQAALLAALPAAAKTKAAAFQRG